MIFCEKCSVELEETTLFCPLCGENKAGEGSNKKGVVGSGETIATKRQLTDFKELNQVQRRRLFWQLSGIILISGIIVTLIINLIINRGITWSKYSMSACLVLFLDITLVAFSRKKTIAIMIGSFLSISILLILYDTFNNNIGWSITLGIPLVLSIHAVVFILMSLIKSSKQRGFNLIAYVLIATGILSICIEGIISQQLYSRISLQWSIITLLSVLPVSIFLLFVHYRLRRGTDLKRFFHI